MTLSITPVSIWKAGSLLQATDLEAYIISDDLSNNAVLYYRLLTSTGEELASGNLVMADTNYVESNSNRISWVLTELNLTTL